jgi:hypothetical protein
MNENKMKKKLTLCLAMAALWGMTDATRAVAQDKLKVSGYIQGQFQWGEEAALLKIGSANENGQKPFSRIGIRRGRVKLIWEQGLTSAVFQLDLTEKGVGIKDAYLNLKAPWFQAAALRAGVFDRPFGYEISYSSSRRESPERSTIFQTLFPDERDLGAMVIFQAPASSPWSLLKLEAGFFAGNGIKLESDSKRDFIRHLSAAKIWGSLTLGGGVSHYNGRVYQGSRRVYTMDGDGFIPDQQDTHLGAFAKRRYTGFDLQVAFKSLLGSTRLHGEYLFGQQPGTDGSSKSPNAPTAPVEDTYIRDFSGGYAMLVQSLGKAPVSVAAKYDVYDPNTRVSGERIGENWTTATDLEQRTLGFGALWDLNADLRLTAWYDINRNEHSKNLTDGFDRDLKNDVFTLRMQYKF